MSASRRTFVSPLGVEADQKELIIAHLKEEIYLLKRNEQELFRLQEQYQALDHRLKALQDQKIQADYDFKDRHELALRTIGQLKNQLDALRNDQRQRNLQLSDLNSDEGTLLGQLDQRAIELNKLKNDLTALLADNQQLLNERLRLEQTSTGVKKDNEQIAVNIRDFSNSLDGVRRKIEQLENYLGKKKEEEALLKDKIMKYQEQNNGIDADINTVNEQLGTLEADTSTKQAELSGLQKSTAEMGGQSYKQRGEALHYQKCTQAEVMRNNDLNKQLNQAEKTLRLRNGQVAQGYKTKEAITAENNKLAETNNKLRSDIESASQHLQSLSLLNTQFVQSLQKYTQEDDMVRTLIDRKLRVVRARNRIEQAALSKNPLQGSPRKSRHY